MPIKGRSPRESLYGRVTDTVSPFSSTYAFQKRLGKGSYGEVNQVKRLSDGKFFVCKVMHYGSLSEREKQLIVSEVNILRELCHPNIVRYHDRIIDKKLAKIYVIMEYCEGGDLGQEILKRRRRGRGFTEARIWKTFTQILLAFEECHRHKENGVLKPILHRDIKPCNVFLDHESNVKLGDFGLAKQLQHQDKLAQTWVGTPYYMAPEMINEESYDEKCDIWSLGCLLYEMATLHPPFEAKSVISLGKKIVSGKFAPIPSRYSADLQNVVSSMLSTNSKTRPRVSQLLQHPALRYYVREGRFTVREYKSLMYIGARHKELLSKESQLKKKNREIQRRESELQRKEQALRELERRLRESKISEGSTWSQTPSCSPCSSLVSSPMYYSPFEFSLKQRKPDALTKADTRSILEEHPISSHVSSSESLAHYASK